MLKLTRGVMEEKEEQGEKRDAKEGWRRAITLLNMVRWGELEYIILD